jgi:phage FluMu protein Com
MKVLFKCNFCGKTWKKKFGPKSSIEQRCPKCKEYDVELIQTNVK